MSIAFSKLCVSQDLHCGAGIAAQFKAKYGGIDYLKSQNKHGVRKLAMPLIACGLDRQPWNQVQKLLENVMGHTVVDIIVYTARERRTEWPPLSFAETSRHKPATRRSPLSRQSASPRIATTHKSPPSTQPTICTPPKKTPKPPIQPPPKEPLLGVTAASGQDCETQELTIVGEAPATTGDTQERSPAAAAPHAVEPSPPCVSPEKHLGGESHITHSDGLDSAKNFSTSQGQLPSFDVDGCDDLELLLDQSPMSHSYLAFMFHNVSHPFLGDYVRLRKNVQWKKICVETNDQYVVFADIINKITRSSGKTGHVIEIVTKLFLVIQNAVGKPPEVIISTESLIIQPVIVANFGAQKVLFSFKCMGLPEVQPGSEQNNAQGQTDGGACMRFASHVRHLAARNLASTLARTRRSLMLYAFLMTFIFLYILPVPGRLLATATERSVEEDLRGDERPVRRARRHQQNHTLQRQKTPLGVLYIIPRAGFKPALPFVTSFANMKQIAWAVSVIHRHWIHLKVWERMEDVALQQGEIIAVHQPHEKQVKISNKSDIPRENAHFEANFGAQTVLFSFKCIGLAEVQLGQIKIMRKGSRMRVLFETREEYREQKQIMWAVTIIQRHWIHWKAWEQRKEDAAARCGHEIIAVHQPQVKISNKSKDRG
ncbi:hypothetical protein B566_EDAN017400 [Ephemera danica]|nr:hypothetical protein B566_EDAN017400 [Ephemera danica]